MAASALAGPPIAVVHQMARTGGTLVNRCLGAMRDILVLSEVHPLDPRRKIVPQAANWFGLLGEDDVPWLRDVSAREPATVFAEIAVRLAERSAERGRHLVLRDWSHLDFLGVPFVPDPPMRLLTEEVLRDRCELRQAFIVRHPLDQYASSAARPTMGPHLTPARFLDAYLAFARAAADRGFQRYEDLVESPDQNLRRLCEKLCIPFDPGYRERWPSYDKLTGDSTGPSRRYAKRQIIFMPGISLDPATRDSLRRHHGFQECLTLLGYVDGETQ